MFERLLDIIFPDTCIGCARTGSVLCAMCERTINTRAEFIGNGYASLFDYHNPLVKQGIWSLKYDKKRSMGKYFGIALYREFFKDLLLDPAHERETIILIPIPLSKKSKRARGYNHTEIIANAIMQFAEADGLPVIVDTTILKKIKETMRQVETPGRIARYANLKGAFGVTNGERIKGHTIVLIDDVITTGTTFNEARNVLLRFAPSRVLGIAVAH